MMDDSLSGDYLRAIQYNAEIYPERTAMVTREGSVSYQRLWRDSDTLASYLARKIGTDNSPLVIYGHKSPLMLVCMLACVKSGHSYVPVDVSTPLFRVKDILAQTQSEIVFAVSDLETPRAFSADQIQAVIDAGSDETLDEVSWVQGEDVFYIIFTSGSTGSPKGVQVTRNCIDHFYPWPAQLIGLDDKPRRFLNQAPFSFDLSVYELTLSLTSGGTLVCLDNNLLEDFKELFAFFATSDTQVWVSTPSFVEMCLADPSFDERLLPSLDTFLFCGEALRAKTVEKIKKRFTTAAVFNTYGPTEATVAVTGVLVSEEILAAGEPLPVGFSKPGTVVTVVGQDGGVLPQGESGEIIITGTTVSKGYYARPDLTDDSFVLGADGSRSYRTGDLGHLDEKGCLYCEGRIDSQIKLNGYRIELEDIESNLNQMDIVSKAAVVCARKNGKVSYIAAFVCVRSHLETSTAGIEKALRADLLRFLPHYMIPRKFIFCESLPVTNNGKIDRKNLEDSLR